jgi:hypothetical protein
MTMTPASPSDPYVLPATTAPAAELETRPGKVAEFWAAARPGAAPTALLAAGAVGIAGAVLLAGQRPGLGAALVALAGWGVALPALVRRRRAGDLVLAGWSVLLLITIAIRDAPWLVALSWVVGIGAAVVALTGGRTATGVLTAPLAAAGGVVRAIPWTGHGLRGLVHDRGRAVWTTVRSVAVALLLLLVFGALFASADPMFAKLLPHATLNDVPARIVVGAFIALMAAAAAHLGRTGTPWADTAGLPATPARPVEWLIPVVALDALVLVFLGVWLSALARGNAYIEHATGLTYAQYARQGFGQLVAVTALTLVVVAVAARRAPLGTRIDRIRTRVALGTLCVGTLGIVASSLARMSLYVDAYGLTRLRLLAGWGEVAMGAIVVLVLVAGVRWRGAWLPRAAVHVVAVAMLSLAVVNPDALVVRYDAAATDLPGGLDVTYMSDLSADAVPAIDALDEPMRRQVLDRMTFTPGGGVAGWNYGRAHAEAVLGR